MAADDLCTLAEVRTAAKVPAGDTSDDSRISAAIEYVTALIKGHCNRTVLYNPAGATVVTEQIDGHGNDELYLAEWPIDSVTSVHEDLDRAFGAATLLTENTDFLVYSEDGLLKRLPESGSDNIVTGLEAGVWARGSKVIKVVYVPGYTTIPTALKMVALTETIRQVNQFRGKGLTRVQRSLSSEDYDSRALLPESRSNLGPYRSLRLS